MRKIILFGVLIASSILLGFILGRGGLTGRVIEDFPENFSYTFALCNEEESCVDVFVECDGKVVSSISFVSDFLDFSNSSLELPKRREELCLGNN
jgi:hypothetical protein